jgi:tRNA wybutosine-synthesizing protein 4
VIVHEAATEQMSFKAKNFVYTPKPFGEFLDQIEAGQRLYLRALSAEKPSELPTNISRDFPTIAADFVLPPE